MVFSLLLIVWSFFCYLCVVHRSPRLWSTTVVLIVVTLECYDVILAVMSRVRISIHTLVCVYGVFISQKTPTAESASVACVNSTI